MGAPTPRAGPGRRALFPYLRLILVRVPSRGGPAPAPPRRAPGPGRRVVAARPGRPSGSSCFPAGPVPPVVLAAPPVGVEEAFVGIHQRHIGRHRPAPTFARATAPCPSTIVFVGWSQAPRSSFVIIIFDTKPWAVLSGISNVAHGLLMRSVIPSAAEQIRPQRLGLDLLAHHGLDLRRFARARDEVRTSSSRRV